MLSHNRQNWRRRITTRRAWLARTSKKYTMNFCQVHLLRKVSWNNLLKQLILVCFRIATVYFHCAKWHSAEFSRPGQGDDTQATDTVKYTTGRTRVVRDRFNALQITVTNDHDGYNKLWAERRFDNLKAAADSEAAKHPGKYLHWRQWNGPVVTIGFRYNVLSVYQATLSDKM
jgi:hypothetical protein